VIHRESDLVKNILLFSQALRKRKVGVSIDNMSDALRGISLIDIQKKKDLYYLLKSNFISRKEEVGPFDDLFEQFWSFEESKGFPIKKTAEERAETFEEREEVDSFEFKKIIPR